MKILLGGLCLTLAAISFNIPAVPEPPLPSIRQPASEDPFPPVDNMHHFMEYISQPAYQALQQALASEPADRQAWRPVKMNALLLAETSGLVADRAPADFDATQTQQWKQISRDVYDAGKQLYGSIGDYEQARQHYSRLIDNCNRCHQVFVDGKHQLEK